MSHRLPLHITIAAALAALAACTDEGPAVVASVAVTSPIGARLAVGRSVQLGTDVRDAGGRALTVPVTWRSSAPATADVSAQGLADGRAAGIATISAEAGGLTAYLSMRVIAVDFTEVGATLNDPWLVAVSGALTTSVRQAITVALAQCETARQQGNFNALDACIASIRTTTTQATDPNDRALLAQIALFNDHIERRLQP